MWPNATAGSTVQGTCIAANGFLGIAVRSCSVNAVWGPITTPCTAVEAPCPAVLNYEGRTNWPSTTAGATATGTCALGYTFSDGGAPTRLCIGNNTGTWSVNVTNNCIVGTALKAAGPTNAAGPVQPRPCLTRRPSRVGVFGDAAERTATLPSYGWQRHEPDHVGRHHGRDVGFDHAIAHCAPDGNAIPSLLHHRRHSVPASASADGPG